MPKLGRIKINPLLTVGYLAHTNQSEQQIECSLLVARFLAAGGLIQVCPPERTAAQLLKRKPGRPPIGEHAMTVAERKRRERDKAKTLPPQERVEPGAVAVPLRPAVPGIFIAYQEIEQMIESLLRQAEKYDAYLGEVLDRLADAPPDYILTREEFTIVAAAAVLADRLLPQRTEYH